MPFRLPFLRSRPARPFPDRVLDVNQMKRLVQREQVRSDRSHLPVSLIRLEFEDRQIDRSRATILRVYEICLHRIRATDEIGEIDAHRIAILLPDTPLDGSEVLADNLRQLARDAGIYLQYTLDSYPLEEDTRRPSEQESLAFDEPSEDNDSTHSRPLALEAAKNRRHQDAASSSSNSAARDSDSVVRGQTAIADRVAGKSSTAMTSVTIRPSAPVRRIETATAHLHFAADLLKSRRRMPAWKRAIDVTGAVAGLTLLSPLLAGAWLLVRLTSPGPGLFAQVRDGYLGQPFTLYKFRTMRQGAETEQEHLLAQNEQDGPAFKLSDDPRVTPIGAILRRTCVDELPQLWNVLRGEMSLVGPRPLPCDESSQCAPWQSRRLLVKPGLTCYWQTYRSNEIPFADWMRMDLQYTRRMSLRTDLGLVVATVLSIAGKRPVFAVNSRDN